MISGILPKTTDKIASPSQASEAKQVAQKAQAPIPLASTSSTALTGAAMMSAMLAAQPKKLKELCLNLTDESQKEKEGKDETKTDEPFAAERSQLKKMRSTRLMQAVAACARIIDFLTKQRTALCQKKIIYPIQLARDPMLAMKTAMQFQENYNQDTQAWASYIRDLITRLEFLNDTGQDSVPSGVYILWHIFDEAEKQHKERYEDNVATQLSCYPASEHPKIKMGTNRLLNGLKEIYKLKELLEQIEVVQLYILRLKEFQLSKRRALHFAPGWQVMDKHEKITGFAAACRDYRKQFERILLMRSLQKSSAFESLSNLGTIVRLERTPEFSAVFTQEVPAQVSEKILGWLTKSIEQITQPVSQVIIKGLMAAGQVPDEKATAEIEKTYTDDIVTTFIGLVGNEQLLKDTMSFAHSIVVAIQKKTGSLQSVCDYDPASFAKALSGQALIDKEKEEQKEEDRQRLRELRAFEKDCREKEAKEKAEAEEKAKVQAFTFAAQLKKENEDKLASAKRAKKEELMANIKRELGSARLRELIKLLDPAESTHDKFKEDAYVSILSKIDVLEDSSGGYKIKSPFKTSTSTHRSHNSYLDATFCQEVREFFRDIGVTGADLEGVLEKVRDRDFTG